MRNADRLRVVALAKEIALQTYRITASFPRSEQFGLVSQMRRAAVSIGSNIAEGCGRSSDIQLRNFLQIASGSATELEFQASLAEALEMGGAMELRELQRSIQNERRMLWTYYAYLSRNRSPKTSSERKRAT